MAAHAGTIVASNEANSQTCYSQAVPPEELRRQYLIYQHRTPLSKEVTLSSSDDGDYRSDPSFSYPSPYQHNHHIVPTLKPEYTGYATSMADVPYAARAEPVKLGFTKEDSVTTDGRIEMDQDEVDAIIRNRRKVRDPKACYACHRRKVKCDRGLPCDSCVKRDHPELCSYERPSKKKRITLNHGNHGGTQNVHTSNPSPSQADHGSSNGRDGPQHLSGPNITVSREQWDRINAELRKLKASMGAAEATMLAASTDTDDTNGAEHSDHQEREGVHARSTQMGTMHLGSRSVLAYMMGSRSPSSQDSARLLLEEDILPNLGLDNETATYPFVDLWSSDSSMQDVSGLCRALPEDQLCQQFWTAYRDVACTIYPVVPDIDEFERQLDYMLRRRAESVRMGHDIDPDRPHGMSLSWLALVFSVLASGAQCTSMGAKERELTSQALRMANFMSHPCLETIEACLIIGNALSFNMNPGVSYTFLGMTLRSAFTMGLHVNSHKFTEEETYLRGRIWWSLSWQDSHFSISYDRPTSSMYCFPDIPYTKTSSPGNRSYVESMCAIIRLTQEILRDRVTVAKRSPTWSSMARWRDEVNRIMNDAKPSVRDRHSCHNTIDHLERVAFQLHASYMISEICRPALKETQLSSSGDVILRPATATPTNSPGASKAPHAPESCESVQIQAQLRSDCLMHLESVVAAYVELHEVSVSACRSWVGIQRSLSAAFLLGIIPEARQEPRITALLKELEVRIAKRAREDTGFGPVDLNNYPMAVAGRRMTLAHTDTSESPNWAQSMTKSLNALSKLNAALAGQATAETQPTRGMTPQEVQHSHAKTSYGVPSMQHHPNPSQTALKHGNTPPNTAAMYATPVVSPANTAANSVAHTLPSNMPLVSNMASYAQPPPQMSHHPQGPAPSPYSPTSGHAHMVGGYSMASSHAPTGLSLAALTPESASSSDWHYGNLAERAMEYVQPGLWG